MHNVDLWLTSCCCVRFLVQVSGSTMFPCGIDQHACHVVDVTVCLFQSLRKNVLRCEEDGLNVCKLFPSFVTHLYSLSPLHKGLSTHINISVNI